jgi:hypothetical protein
MNDASPITLSSLAVGPDVVAESAESPKAIALPRDPQSFAMTAILTILVFVILYFTGGIVLPIIFAFLLNLLLQPAMEVLIKFHIPKTVAALFPHPALYRRRGRHGLFPVRAGGGMDLESPPEHCPS